MTVKAAILTGYGINCDRELQSAFQLAGAQAERVHLNELLHQPEDLRQYHILGFPGGFSFGDDCGAGNIFAKKIIYHSGLRAALNSHLDQGKLIFGVCNGNQISTFLNLIPVTGNIFDAPEVAYSFNDSARYEDRGNIHLQVVSGKSHWLQGLEGKILPNIPVGHGEGNFQTTPDNLEKIQQQGLVALKYVHSDGTPANEEYPINPNGSVEDIAGLASEQVLLMMPHPERAISAYGQDGWTRRKSELKRQGKKLPEEGAGLQIFRNGVNYVYENLIRGE